MKARPDGRPEAENRKLDHVQEATRSEIERYRGYDSARDVIVNFRRDLNSHAAEKARDLHVDT